MSRFFKLVVAMRIPAPVRIFFCCVDNNCSAGSNVIDEQMTSS